MSDYDIDREAKAYFELGGLWNPEMMNGPAVKRLIVEMHTEIGRLRAALGSRGVHEEPKCDCGRALTMCVSCATEDYQAAHPDCKDCCVPAAALRGVGTPQEKEPITERLLKLASTFDDALGRCALYGNADQVRDTWHTLKFALIDAHKQLAGTPHQEEKAQA